MLPFAWIVAAGLIVVGVAYPLAKDTASITAWIPAMLGAAIAILAWVAGSWESCRGCMLIAMRVVAAAGLGASLWRLWKGGIDSIWPVWEMSRAHQSQALTALLCLALLLRSLRS